MRKYLSISWLCVLIVLVGCGSTGGSKVTPKPVSAVSSGMPARPLWEMNIGSTGRFAYITPILVNDQIFTASESGTIIALTTEGRVLWQINAGFRITVGVGADEEMVMVGGSRGQLAAFDTKTGRMLWETSIGGEVSAPPLVTSDVAAIRTLDGRVSGLNRSDGSLKWVYQRILPSLILHRTAPMSFAQDYIFVGYPGGRLVVLEQSRGSLAFEENVSIPRGSNELERLTDIASRPVIRDMQVCAAAFQGRTGCFSLRGGAAMWFRNIPSTGGLDIDNEEVFVIGDDGFLYALDKDLGTEKWKTEVLAGDRSLRPVAFKDSVTVADSFGFLHFFSRSGEAAGRINVDGSPLVSAPIMIPDKGILAQTRGGRLVLLAP